MASSSRPPFGIDESSDGPGATTPRGGQSPRGGPNTKPDDREEEENRKQDGKFSLRGAKSSQTEDKGHFGDPRLKTAIMTEKEIRITVNPLPTQFERFPDWWFQTESAILAAGPDPEATLIYLDELDELTFDDLFSTLPRIMLALDVKVYAQIIQAIKAPEHDKHMRSIRAQVRRGCGRQVIRVLTIGHKHDLSHISNKAARMAVTDIVKTVEG
jgi:hypothetical protein